MSDIPWILQKRVCFRCKEDKAQAHFAGERSYCRECKSKYDREKYLERYGKSVGGKWENNFFFKKGKS